LKAKKTCSLVNQTFEKDEHFKNDMIFFPSMMTLLNTCKFTGMFFVKVNFTSLDCNKAIESSKSCVDSTFKFVMEGEKDCEVLKNSCKSLKLNINFKLKVSGIFRRPSEEIFQRML
jgi:hypothetical protein